jgi:hypothetical protein
MNLILSDVEETIMIVEDGTDGTVNVSTLVHSTPVHTTDVFSRSPDARWTCFLSVVTV